MTVKSKTNTKVKETKSLAIGKKILVDRINDKIGKKQNLTKSQIDTVLNEYLEQTKQALVQGEEIRLVGYYTFKTIVSKPRVAFNLKTKAKIDVPAKLTPKIKFSKDLKEEIAKK